MGKLYIVATPIGNLGDMTMRGVEILKSVKYIAAEDTRHSLKLLNHFGITNKLLSLHKFNESEKSGYIIDLIINEDCDIALVSDAGTPCISDPGYLLVKKAHEKGVKVYGVSGACAAVTALSVSGIDSFNFSFLGFFPKTKKEKEDLVLLINNSQINTFIIYESPLRILETIKYLCNNFPDAILSVSNDLTKLHETTYMGKIDEVYNVLSDNPNASKGEYAIILGKKPNPKKETATPSICLEAQILDAMLTNNLSYKSAVSLLAQNNADTKNNLYQASLRLKEYINGLK